MKKKSMKLFMFLGITLILLLGISSINAQQTDDTTTANIEEIQHETTSVSPEINKVSEKTEITKTNKVNKIENTKIEQKTANNTKQPKKDIQDKYTVNTPEELTTAFNEITTSGNSETNYEITLNSNTYDLTQFYTWGVTSQAAKNLTIIGSDKNTVIIKPVQGSAFRVNANYNLILKTLTIKDANITSASYQNYGGALTNAGNMTLNDTIIKDCVAINGGAIKNTGILTIDQSIFQNNNATKQYGGAIYNTGTNLTIYNSQFIANNNPGMNGGAIVSFKANSANTTIINTTFTNNTAKTSGAAIYANGKELKVINSTFTGNNITSGTVSSGGVIYSMVNTTIENSIFSNNTIKSGCGGSIYASGSTSQRNIINTTFTNNTATRGGAIYASSNTTIENSTFNQNKAEIGGAIATPTLASNLEISNSNFTNNKAENGNATGGAINLNPNTQLTVDSSNFINNSANIAGVIANTKTAIISNSNFTNNTANTSAVITNNGTLNLKGNTFDNNKADDNNIIQNSENGNTIEENNTYVTDGIPTQYTVSTVDEFDEVYNKIITLGIKDQKYEITLSPDIVYNFEKSYIWGNTNQEANILTIKGLNKNTTILNIKNPSLFKINPNYTLNLETLTLANGTITSSSQQDNGGAITNNGNLNINNTIIENSTSLTAGAIYNTGNLTVNNTLFKNNNATRLYGGAIYNIANTTIDNSIFDNNNNNVMYGGAIANFNKNAILYITNTTFTNNTSQQSGSAIYNNGLLKINNSNFIDNKVQAKYGGAIFNDGLLNITDSTFTNNTAIEYGGAIYTKNSENDEIKQLSQTNIINSTFTNNNATCGGAIFTTGNINITKSTFTNNTAIYGGVIYGGNDTTNLTILSSNFTNNTVTTPNGTAGVIYTNNNTITQINDSLFKNNKAIAEGGVIYNIGNMTILYSNFTDNSVNTGNYTSGFGGTIANSGRLNLLNSKIEYSMAVRGGAIKNNGSMFFINHSQINNNHATYYGGAIQNYYRSTMVINDTSFIKNIVQQQNGGAIINAGDLNISQSTFTNNTAFASMGGALYLQELSEVYIEDTSFISNKAKLGGAITNTLGTKVFINNSLFNQNNGTNSGGVLYNTNRALAVINNTIFTNNYATNKSAAIFNFLSSNVTVENSTFITNHAERESGGAIYNRQGSILIVKSSNFTDNDAFENGGAIYTEGLCNITSSEFNQNYVEYDGGAVYNSGNLIINDSILKNNAADVGGAISSYGNITSNNNTYQDNQAASFGGSLYAHQTNITVENDTYKNSYSYGNGGSLYIEICNFTMNNTLVNSSRVNIPSGTTTTYGGAMVIKNSTALINNTLFINNTAATGGAVSVQHTNLTILNSLFENNSARFGGAMAYYSNGNLMINNTTFTKNLAGNTHGGAIFINNANPCTANATITSSKFIDNEAVGLGGAIIAQNVNVTNGQYLKIKDTLFENNTSERGGAVNVMFTNLTIDNATFINNIADESFGGAISANMGYEMNINNSKFINNSVKAEIETQGWGGAIYISISQYHVNRTDIPKTTTITNSIFDGNYAPVGGAIYNNETLILNNVTFTNNSAMLAGVIYNRNETIINNSNFINNKIDVENITEDNKAGVICNNGILTINNSIFHNNSAPYSSVILNRVNTTLNNVTFTNNTAAITELIDNEENNNVIATNNTYASNHLPLNMTIKTDDTYYENMGSINIQLDTNPIYNTTINTGTIHVISGNEIIHTHNVTTNNFNITIPLNKIVDNKITLRYSNPNKDFKEATENRELIILNRKDVTININTTNTKLNDTTIITGNLVDNDNNPIKNEQITIQINKENPFNITTDENGVFTYIYTPKQVGQNTITITHLENENYKNATKIQTFNVDKLNVSIKLDPINGYIKNTVTIKATIKDENGNPVNTGRVSLKVNGITLKDENGKTRTFNVVNGEVLIKITAPVEWKNSKITMVYSENNQYKEQRITEQSNITSRKPTFTIDTIKPAKAGETITLTAKLTANDEKISGGRVVFKINGVTIKDKNGNPIYGEFKDGIASIKYTIPMMNAKTYNITAVYSNNEFGRIEAKTQPLTMEKLNVSIKLDPINGYIKNTVTIKATIKDENGNLVNTGRVSLKFNGITLKDENGKTRTFNVVNGEVLIKITAPAEWKNSKITIVYSENNQYKEQRITEQSNITSRKPTFTIDTIKPAKAGETITLTAKLTANDEKISGGRVVFKINGVTIKDKNGSPIYGEFKDGSASIKYIIPTLNAKTYNITAVYSNNEFGRIEAKTQPLTIEKVATKI